MAKKAKKTILAVLIVLVVVILGGLLTVKHYGSLIVKTGVERAGSKVLKVGVRIDDVDLWVFDGKAELHDLEIDNPEGYTNDHFLTMEFGHIELNVGSLFSDTVEIRNLQLDNIVLDLEQKGLTNNLQVILNNLPKAEEPKEVPAEEKAGKNLVINDLLINKVTVNVQLLPVPGKADTLKIELEPIHMTDVGTEKKINTAILISKILTAIAAGIAKQGGDILPTEMIGPLTNTLQETGMQILESGQDIIKQGTDLGEGVKGAVEGLFRKKEE